MSAEAPTPLVSIIVPAFNAERTVADSVRSASRGRYRNVEIIIVDDGSTDRTGEIAEQLADEDPRVRAHSRPNGGPSAAFNSGLKMARGEYVARLDADDLWHSDKLAHQMALAASGQDAGLIACRVRYIDGEDRVTSDGPAQIFPRRALCRGYVESLVGIGSSALIPRALVEEVGGYDESLRSWEDLLLQLEISARHPVAVLPDYLVGYRISEASITRDPVAMLAGWRSARKQIAGKFPQIPGWVDRWAHARRMMMFAEAFAWRGDYLRSATCLGEAKLTDPAWAIRFLAYRLARRLRKSARPNVAEPGPNFLSCDPGDTVRPAPDTPSGVLARFEAARNRRIAAIDAQIAETGDGT